MSSFDGLSLINTRNGIFNNLAIILNSEVKDLFDIFALKGDITSIIGLAPATLNTLNELANAMNNDPDFFEYIRDQLDLKRNISDSYDKNYINNLIAAYYTKTQTDTLLNDKLNSSEINKYYTITQTSNLYLDKATWNANIPDIVLSLNGKVEGSDLITYYYNRLTTNSILESYYI